MYENNCGAKLSQPVSNDSAVASALSRQTGANGDLRMAIDSLCARLSPVLSPQPPGTATDSGVPSYSCELAQAISNQADSTYYSASVIHDLLSRLGI